MFWGALALFVLVLALLALSYLRPAALSGLRPMHWIVGGGLVMPVPILIALLVAALVLGERLLPRVEGTAPLRVAVEASQFAWQVSYPDTPGAEDTVNVLHIPAGEPVDIVVTSADVVHSFWVPRLGGKIDAVPGHTNVIRLSADRPGTYRGVCAEYCGVGHDIMSLVVEAHEPEDFAAALGVGP